MKTLSIQLSDEDFELLADGLEELKHSDASSKIMESIMDVMIKKESHGEPDPYREQLQKERREREEQFKATKRRADFLRSRLIVAWNEEVTLQ